MFRKVRLLLAALLLLLAAMPAVPPPVASAQVRDGATMTVLRGQVAVIHADGTAVQPAPSGTLVKAGDEIRTLSKTGALITFFTGTEIEMGEDTILAVDRIAVDGSKVDISLKQVFGTTLNRVQSLTDPSSVYRIDAGGATAVVRGTTFLLIGPVATSRGNISALICLDDCDGRTSFAGCPVAPFTAFGVQVGGGKAQSDCEVTSVDKGADYWNAAFEAITTFEQTFASASGDTSPGVSNPGRDDGQRHADQRQDREDRDQKDVVTVFSSCSIIAGGPPAPGPSPSLFGGFGSVTEGNAGPTTLNVSVFLLPAASSTVTVNYAIGTAGTTATPSVDFVAGSGTLTFAPGVTQQDVPITVNGDLSPELNELVIVTLSGASGAPIGSATAIGVIQDDDSPITVSVLPTSVIEGNTGTTSMQFTVTLSRTSPATFNVDYQTIGAGTAISGVDYTPVPLTTLNIPANTLTATFTVPILTDTIPEPDKTVQVQISNPTSGATLGASTASGTIVDDDGPVSVSIGNAIVAEGCDGTTHAAFTLTLSAPSGTTVTVNYTTANGTATAGSDYQSTSGSVTFAPGTTIQNVIVQVIGDAIPEPDETFQVNLTTATGATISVPSGTGTIQNDD
ncbi:MAG: FecR domain-containing protein [Chloroflexi bacterium]|nr:FecR domain-containing protein [Chloroflexota bacterium]